MRKAAAIAVVALAACLLPSLAGERVEGFPARVAWKVDQLGRFVLLVDRPGEREGTVDLAIFYVPATRLPSSWRTAPRDAHVEITWSGTTVKRVRVVDTDRGEPVLQMGPIGDRPGAPPVETAREGGEILLRGGRALAIYTGEALWGKPGRLLQPGVDLVRAIRALLGRGMTTEDLLPTFTEAHTERIRIVQDSL